ncbi:MAG: hypothetical protein COB69_02575 [Phycisphaera sp.]|nr:MAG: hypothetical protein COB69_02575 [Phycisphaera sp.]
MRHLSLLVLAGLLSHAAAVEAQTVTYVTRGQAVGHAIAFGSSPLRGSSTTSAAGASAGRHAIAFGSYTLRAELPKAYIEVNNSPHTVAGAQKRVQSTASRTVGPRSRQTTDRQSRRVERKTNQAASPRPSRHMLQIIALMDNKLDCHR